MGLFDSILSNIKATITATEMHQQEIVDCIAGIINIKIQKENISLRKGILHISGAPTVKATLLLKKEALITALQSKGITVYEII